MNPVTAAARFAQTAHTGQERDSGEPYITHPKRVMRILRKYNLSESVQIAGLLHDVLEDTSFTLQEIKEKFGEPVAFLVFAVTKTVKDDYFKKLKDYATQNEDVILLKMADRIDNLSTMGCFKLNRKLRYIKESYEMIKMFNKLVKKMEFKKGIIYIKMRTAMYQSLDFWQKECSCTVLQDCTNYSNKNTK